MRFSVYQVSRKGGREKNEDRMGYCYTRESGLFVLADGMGGHPEGDRDVHQTERNRALPDRAHGPLSFPDRGCASSACSGICR